MTPIDENSGDAAPTPLSAPGMIDLYFLDARSKLLDIAAFLDRVSRAEQTTGQSVQHDFRLLALRKSLEIVAGAEPDRAQRVQMAFSDPTTEPLESAAGMKGATGAWPGR